MPYIGRPIGVAGHTTQKLDDPTGISSNAFTMKVATVAISPDAASLQIYVDGVRQEAGVAYTVSGSTITFTGTFTSSNDFHGYVMGDAMYVEDNFINEAKLRVSNAPTNGQFLSAQSGDTGGLTWAAVTSPAITAITGTAANQILTDDGDATVTSEANLTYDGTTFGVDDAAVFNESGNDNDFRVEGSGAENALFVQGSDGYIGIGTSSPTGHLDVEDTAITIADDYYGIVNTHTRTGGVTDNEDNLYGIDSRTTFNNNSGYFGYFAGMVLKASSTDTNAGESVELTGLDVEAAMSGDTDVNNIYGIKNVTNIDAGTIDTGVWGIYSKTDIESGVTSIGSNAYGGEFWAITDQNPAGAGYGISSVCGANIDFSYISWDIDNGTYRFQVTDAGVVNSEGAMNASQNLDYAEYFESKDGNAISVGTTVKLDGEKIVVCLEGDTPLGVIRPANASATIGGGQLFHWAEKYEKDDYGALIWEDYSAVRWNEEITRAEYNSRGKADEKDGIEDIEKEVDGVTKYYRKHRFHTDRIPEGFTAPEDAITFNPGDKRQKINSAYDASNQYQSREERDEWHIVGLLGQIPITKGQPVADNWIKMKDVSDTVEMWFVK